MTTTLEYALERVCVCVSSVSIIKNLQHLITLVQVCIAWYFESFNPSPHLHFAILERTWGGCHPPLVCPLNEIDLGNKDKRKDRDVLNLTIPDFTTLGHILTFRG